MGPMGVARVQSTLPRLLRRIRHDRDRVVILQHGRAVAALVLIEDLDFLEKAEDYFDDRRADEAEREAEGKPLIPFEEIKRRLGLE